MSTPKVADLFGDLSPKAAAERHEEYVSALAKAAANPIDPMSLLTGAPMAKAVTPTAAIESVLANESVVKSMAPDALASLSTALEAQRAASADIVKDLTLQSPIGTGLVAYDLEAPAKLLTPRPTPLRNKIVRKKGTGTSHRIKRITGFTGTGTGGVGNIHPGIADSTYTQFGQINYLRGPKISYAGDDKTFAYKQFSLSDAVPFSAQFQGAGYQDIRQLSQTSVLYASMLMEERMLLMGRGQSSDGFSGALAAPSTTGVTATARAKTATETGLASGTYYIKITADAGSFGESPASAVITVTGVTTGQVIDVAFGSTFSDIAQALGYKVYAGTTNADASLFYQGRVGSSAATFTVGALALATTGAVSPGATDTSFSALGYDGILPTILANASNAPGTVSRLNGTFSNSNPGVEFQSIFAALYDTVKADPDEILFNGADRKQLSDSIKGASNSNYKLHIAQEDLGGVVLGDVVTGLQNEVTGKGINLVVHPWMPQGNAAVLSYTLPIPDTNVSEVWAVFNTQDYMAIEWPVTQFAYETSTYWNGTFVCAAPSWNGALTGIKAA